MVAAGGRGKMPKLAVVVGGSRWPTKWSNIARTRQPCLWAGPPNIGETEE